MTTTNEIFKTEEDLYVSEAIDMPTTNEIFKSDAIEDLYISGEEEYERYYELSQMGYDEIKEIAESLGIKGIDFYGTFVAIVKIIRAESALKKCGDQK
jgi:hypothetical protein